MSDRATSTGRARRLGRWAALGLVAAGVAAGGWLLLRSLGPTPEERWRRLAAAAGLERPNVVLVTLDTLRADRLGCYGNTEIATPAIDALAREGVRFAHAASTVPFTLPAHSSMMTGTYPPHHGVRENVGYFLDEQIPTLAELLAAGGYATAGFVSAFVLDGRWGIGRGFGRYFDDFDLGEMDRADLGSVQRDGAETVAEAVRWLDDRPAGPFFLWLHLFDPHDPYRPPEPFRSRYPDRPYDGEVAYTDSLVGRFRDALEERGLLDRSLVILTADHGEGLGSHRESFHGYFVYDSTIHVPLIVRPPFGGLGGRVVERAVSHVDLLPTALAAAGLAAPAAVQGESLLPLLLGVEPEGERGVYSESFYPLFHYGWSALRALRTARYKYVDAPRAELYDLAADPGERRNLVSVRPRLARQLEEQLAALAGGMARAAPPARQPEIDEATLRQLQALGYVAGRGEAAAAGDGGAPRADPKDMIDLHQLIMGAQSDFARGEPEAAAARLAEVLARDPTILDAHQMLGTIANQRSAWEEAIPHFQAALALDADHKASLFGLATAYRRLGRAEEALVGFERLLALNPHDSKAALALVAIEVEAGRPAAALAALEAIGRRQDAPPILANQLGELLVLVGRPAEAAAEFRRAIAASDELAQPRFNLAVLLEEAGDLRAAAALYEQAIARAPRHYQAQFNLARLHGELGDRDRQQAMLEAALDSNPDFVRGHYFLAKLLMDRGGDLARAEELTRRGLAKDPEHRSGPLGYYLLADILNRRGRGREARLAVDRARQIEGRGGSPSGG